MMSIPAYNEYARSVLIPQIDPKVVVEIKKLEAEKKYEDPQYMQLLLANFYTQHILRMPPEQWPDGVNRAFAQINKDVYIPMQGPSEMGASGKLERWDRVADLKQISVPALTIGAKYDTMDPAHMEMVSRQVQHGRYLYCPNGSHLAMYDDQQTYMSGVIQFLKDVDTGRF